MRIKNLFIDSRAVRSLKIDGRPIAFVTEPVASDALCFTAEEANSTVKLTKNGYAPTVNLQTSTNGSSWTPYTVNDVITLTNVGNKVYFKAVGSNSAMGSSQSDYNKFVMTGKIAASGNVNSLLEEDENTARTMSLEGKNFCYAYLFSGAPLTTAPELPATTLAFGCYAMMFNNCTSLTKAPVLPATTLADFCYYYMFENCTALTEAPELPAYQLVDSCYAYMFQGCTSLNYVSVGFDNWYPTNATDNWLNNVASTGTFVCNSTLLGNTPEDIRSTSTVPSSWNMTS